MGLVVETGAVIAGANSYVSIADADVYHADRANVAWTGTDAAKTAAILKAMTYIEAKYLHRWKGYRTSFLQNLTWPRQTVNQYNDYVAVYINKNSIPQCLKDAVCELALRALTSELAADIAPRDRVKRKKVDVLETEYVTGDFTTRYQVVEQLLSTLLKPLSNDAVRG